MMHDLIQTYWKEYERTHEFGPIRLGMSREEIKALLGEPEDVGGTSRKYRRPRIWKYGSVEFAFEQNADALWLIYAEDAEGNCILSIHAAQPDTT